MPVYCGNTGAKKMSVNITDSGGLDWTIEVEIEASAGGQSVILIGAYLDDVDLTHIMSGSYIRYLESKAADKVYAEVYS